MRIQQFLTLQGVNLPLETTFFFHSAAYTSPQNLTFCCLFLCRCHSEVSIDVRTKTETRTFCKLLKSYSSDRTTFLEFVALFPEAFEVTEQGRSQKKRNFLFAFDKKSREKIKFFSHSYLSEYINLKAIFFPFRHTKENSETVLSPSLSPWITEDCVTL